MLIDEQRRQCQVMQLIGRIGRVQQCTVIGRIVGPGDPDLARRDEAGSRRDHDDGGSGGRRRSARRRRRLVAAGGRPSQGRPDRPRPGHSGRGAHSPPAEGGLPVPPAIAGAAVVVLARVSTTAIWPGSSRSEPDPTWRLDDDTTATDESSANVAAPKGGPAPGLVTATLDLDVTDWPYTAAVGKAMRTVVAFCETLKESAGKVLCQVIRVATVDGGDGVCSQASVVVEKVAVVTPLSW